MNSERPKIEVDASEMHGRFNEFLARADEGVEVVIKDEGKVVARIIPGDPGPRPRRSRSVRITPRRRTGPRYMPPPVGVHLSPEEIDEIVRASR
jgi:antitoxin (DNA-binding transcriptional repressor) of toxin-antitoxin stability system